MKQSAIESSKWESGSITWTNITGITSDSCQVLKKDGVVLLNINIASSTNTLRYTVGAVIGILPFKPKAAFTLPLYLTGTGTKNGTHMDIDTNGNIIIQASQTAGRYFMSYHAFYETDD